MAKHWSERAQLTCQCGHVARSMAEEARHRHNFPMLCHKPKEKKGHGRQALQAQEVPAKEASGQDA